MGTPRIEGVRCDWVWFGRRLEEGGGTCMVV
jgi:hypothetical protein